MTIENFIFALGGAVIFGTIIVIAIKAKNFYGRLCFKDELWDLKKGLGIYDITTKLSELEWKIKGMEDKNE